MKQILAFAAIYLIWGSSYLAIRVAVTEIPPFLLAGIRFTTAGVILFLFARRGEPALTRREWAETAVAGLLFFAATHALGHWAQVRIPSGVAAVMVATVAFWITGFEALFVTRRPPGLVRILLVVMGFTGVVVLIAPWTEEWAFDRAGILAILCAPVAWAAGSLWSRREAMPRCLPLAAGAEKMIGGVVLLGLATAAGDWERVRWSAVGIEAIAALFFLIVFASIVAFVAYTWLLANVSPTRAATYAFVNPPVAVFLGWLVLEEPLFPRMAAALVLILTSVILLQWREAKAAAVSAPGANAPRAFAPEKGLLHQADHQERVRPPALR